VLGAVGCSGWWIARPLEGNTYCGGELVLGAYWFRQSREGS